MDDNVQKIIDYLGKNRMNAITVLDAETQKPYLPRSRSLKEILEKHGNMHTFFYFLKTENNANAITVELRRKKGSSSEPTSEKNINLTLTVKPLEEENVVDGASRERVTAPDTTNHHNQNQMQHSYQPQNNQSVGLSAVQIAENMVNKDRLEVLKEKVDDLKEDLRDQKKKTAKKENSIEILTLDLRKANSDLANFEQKMELTILKEQIKKEPNFPPEMMGKLLDNLPMVLSSLKSGGNGDQVAQSGLNATESNLSDVKKSCIDLISAEGLPDDMAVYLEKLIYGFTMDKNFQNNAVKLIEQHKL